MIPIPLREKQFSLIISDWQLALPGPSEWQGSLVNSHPTASQKQETLSLNLKASQNAIPRGGAWAPGLECVSGTFKWQAITPHLFVAATGILLQVWPYTLKIGEGWLGIVVISIQTTGFCNFLKLSRVDAFKRTYSCDVPARTTLPWTGPTERRCGMKGRVRTSETGDCEEAVQASSGHCAAKKPKWWIGASAARENG